MNKTEEHSLLEVRAWKEQCYQEDKDLSFKEYREKLDRIIQNLIITYHIRLQHNDNSPRNT